MPRYDPKNGEPKKRDGKYLSQSLKLGYNALADLDGLYEWCGNNFEMPEQITSLDLSFNCFRNVPSVSLKRDYELTGKIKHFLITFEGNLEISQFKNSLFAWK